MLNEKWDKFQEVPFVFRAKLAWELHMIWCFFDNEKIALWGEGKDRKSYPRGTKTAGKWAGLGLSCGLKMANVLTTTSDFSRRTKRAAKCVWILLRIKDVEWRGDNHYHFRIIQKHQRAAGFRIKCGWLLCGLALTEVSTSTTLKQPIQWTIIRYPHQMIYHDDFPANQTSTTIIDNWLTIAEISNLY